MAADHGGDGRWNILVEEPPVVRPQLSGAPDGHRVVIQTHVDAA
ncbi:hypothetical protein ACH4TK_15500 [Streptomyces sp. NPDC021140]